MNRETTTTENLTDSFVLLVNSSFGVYLPSAFMERYADHIVTEGIFTNKEFQEIKTDLEDPNNEFYWDSWQDLEGKALLVIDGKRYTICQNEDLWAIPEGTEIPENWFI